MPRRPQRVGDGLQKSFIGKKGEKEAPTHERLADDRVYALCVQS